MSDSPSVERPLHNMSRPGHLNPHEDTSCQRYETLHRTIPSTYPLMLCGGSWVFSRNYLPKQCVTGQQQQKSLTETKRAVSSSFSFTLLHITHVRSRTKCSAHGCRTALITQHQKQTSLQVGRVPCYQNVIPW